MQKCASELDAHNIAGQSTANETVPEAGKVSEGSQGT